MGSKSPIPSRPQIEPGEGIPNGGRGGRGANLLLAKPPRHQTMLAGCRRQQQKKTQTSDQGRVKSELMRCADEQKESVSQS